MLKTPRFLLTASLALALAFTFSCSGDDGDSPPATLPSSSDAGVSQLPSSPSVAPSSSSEDATLHSSSSHDEELIEVSSSSEEESSSSAAPPPYIPPYNPPYIPPVVPSSSSLAYVPCQGREHYGMYKKEFCDKRDDHEYVYVTIGEGATAQTWMAQNLNYVVEDTIIEGNTVIRSRCYNDDEANCIIYGRLYNWATAMNLPQTCNNSSNNAACTSQIQSPNHQGICPEGWHLPMGSAGSGWATLQKSIGGANGDAPKMRAKSNLWAENPYFDYLNNTDEYGFSALPAGAYYPTAPSQLVSEGYQQLGEFTHWWYAATPGIVGPYKKTLNNSTTGTQAVGMDKGINFYSVRCIKKD